MIDDRSTLDAKMQDYGRERTTGFLLKDYYIVFAEPRTKSGDKPLPHLDEKEHKRIFDEHIAHQLRLEESGQLFAAGLLDEQGKRVGGLIILRATRSRRRSRSSLRIRTAPRDCGITPSIAGA